MKYCDGASFSGNNATVNIDPASGTALYFRGSRVRALMQKDLFAKGLASATDLVVSGCSAGGPSSCISVSRSVQRALLTQWVNRGAVYPCGKRN